MKRYTTLIIASALATYILIVVGGIVRVSGSGLGCPDWPLCEGGFIPPPRHDAWIEFSHRFSALTMSLISLGALILAWFPRRRPAAPWLTAAALLLTGQILLGAVVVLTELPGAVVNFHLLVAMAVFALILVGVVASLPPSVRAGSAHPGLRRLAWVSMIAVFLLLISGSYVFGSGASLACAGWPICEAGLVPTRLLDVINYSHRIVAAVVGVLVFWVAVRAWAVRADLPAVGQTGLFIALAFIIQILIGGGVVLARLDGPWPAFHLALAAAIWGALVMLVSMLSLPAAVESAASHGVPSGYAKASTSGSQP